MGDNKTLMLLFRDQAETPPAVPPTGTCLNCAYTRVLSSDVSAAAPFASSFEASKAVAQFGATWGQAKKLPTGVGSVTPTLLLMRHAGRAGPLLLSGGRQNSSEITGNRTSHNFDNVLVSQDFC